MGADDGGVGVFQGGVVEAELFGEVAAQVVEHGVCAGDELAEHRHALGVLEVEGDAALVAVEGLVELAVAGAEHVRSDGAADVAAFGGVFDLDDVGAEIAEQLGAKWPRAVLLNSEDGDAGERQGAVGGHLVHFQCLDRVLFNEALGDQQALDFVGAFADHQQRRIAIETFDQEFLAVAVAAVDAHRLGGVFQR